MLILPFPGGFRLTCYYYRGAYYKAFWADPPACAVGEPRKTYLGERSFPLILQNMHRYFMYAALVFIVILVVRRVAGAVVEGRRRTAPLRHRRRHARHGGERQRCSASTPSAATRCATSSAAGWTSSRAGPCARPPMTASSWCNKRHMTVRVVQPVLGRAHRRLHPPVLDGHHSRLEDHLMNRRLVQVARARRARHRRRRRRTARGHRSGGDAGRLGRARLQVAPRQGAHRHGRGRHGRGARQRRRARQLEGALRRHHARRPVRQQLAHGRAARARKRPIACASSRRGARSSTAPRTARSSSATSAVTATRASRTSAIAPASR